MRRVLNRTALCGADSAHILLVEQHARAASQTADVGYLLETGEIVHAGPAELLIDDPQLIATYLGERCP